MDQIVDKVRQVAAEIAARHAAEVDLNARFPKETFEALRSIGALAAYVPRELGGLGCDFRSLSAMCTAVAQSCSSAGMVLAMHHIQVACLVRHGQSSPFMRRYLTELAEKQHLIASVTSEVGVGGDIRTSICAVEAEAGHFILNKDATTISYGEPADALLVTARRSRDASPSDQVLVLLEKGSYTLEPTGKWDTLGMRGTCSPGFKLRSSGRVEQILPGSFADSSSRTMVPSSHILWASVWLGIATDAVLRASALVRAEARKKPGTVPPTAVRLAELSAQLQTMRAIVKNAVREFDDLIGSPEGEEAMATIGFALRMNHTKIAASQLVVEIVEKALHICGVAGYRNDSPFGLGRHLRDAHSAPLMIGNDRIHAKSALMLMVFKDEQDE